STPTPNPNPTPTPTVTVRPEPFDYGRSAAYAQDRLRAAESKGEPPPAPSSATSTRTLDLPLTEAQRASSAPVLELPFVARADEEIAGARVHVSFAPPPAGAPALRGVEVLVNDERVALLPPEAVARGEERAVAVEPDRLASRNLLTLRLLGAEGRGVVPGAWRAVKAIRLDLDTTPAALPNDLALLPLPFIDRGYDSAATVPIVIAGEPTPERVRLAAVVASWLALDAPVPLGFDARVGALPDGRALVLVDSAADASRLGLEPPAGPAIRMVDHPLHPGSNAKLVAVGGRDLAELSGAVEALTAREARLVGEAVPLPAVAPRPPAQPYSAPRWLPAGREVPFSEYPEGGTPSHEGTSAATLAVRFRVAPDLWIWPTEFVVLDLGWSQRLPPGIAAPRLDVEVNGYFLATLPAPGGAGEATRHVRLRIPREHMRGFNELRLYVRYPDPDAAARAPAGPPPRVAIAGDSVLHLEGLSHFARLPDVALFAYDGFPFTRVPDLGETAVLLPDRPTPAELADVFSIAARCAQVTGRAATRATFLAAGVAPDAALVGKDLLVVGGADDQPLLARWRSSLPLAFGRGAAVQAPSGPRALLDLAGGIGALLDRRRAGAVLRGATDPAAILGIESPLSPGRSALFVAARSGAALPPLAAFLGYAESRSLVADDVLLLERGQRWMFRIGPSFGRGALDGWTRLRWFLANHWLLLLPLLGLGVAVLGPLVRHAVSARMRERLATAGAPP
ncbi:MAG: cellulose biosynthesis cyclic di-GMP-binding regulatory protein BcsB, partial [Anaeromyxobacteraceae bacterium]